MDMQIYRRGNTTQRQLKAGQN